MFKLNPNPTFNARVEIPVPGADPVAITIIFKHKTRSALKSYFERIGNSNDDAADLVEIVAGWDGVDAEFTPDNLREMTENYPAAAAAIIRVYGSELIRAERKN